MRLYPNDLTTLTLTEDAVPTGFVSQIVASRTTYAISVKDMTDPCGFSYFSDQESEIYAGQIVR